MNKKLKQALGSWVEGERFWGREKDIEIFTKRINDGAHILLVAQRRMGKTSLMKEVARQLNNRYICLFVDLQQAADSPDALVELSLAMKSYKPLWVRTKEIFTNVLDKLADRIEKINVRELGITLRAGLTSGNWSYKGDQLFSILAASDKPVLLLMDEVPIMVNRMLKGEDFVITSERKAAVNEFMSWLRKNSIQHQGKVHIVLSGSIGFEPIIHQANLSATINNFPPYDLRPWDVPTAIGCLQALANEYRVKYMNSAEIFMAKRLGCCIPHHVQMFFTHAYERCIRKGHFELTVEEAEDVYNQEMLGIRGHAELIHYEERLELVLGPEIFPFVLEILTEAAVTGSLTPEALAIIRENYSFPGRDIIDVQKEIIWVLQHDGYLARTSKGYVFVSNLLRDWWKGSHGFSFIPAMKRGV